MAAEDYIPPGEGLPDVHDYARRFTAEDQIVALREQRDDLKQRLAQANDQLDALSRKHDAVLDELGDARGLLTRSVEILTYLDEAVKHCVPGSKTRGPIQEVLRDFRNVMKRKGFA